MESYWKVLVTHIFVTSSLLPYVVWVREAGREVRRHLRGSWAGVVVVGACPRKEAER